MDDQRRLPSSKNYKQYEKLQLKRIRVTFPHTVLPYLHHVEDRVLKDIFPRRTYRADYTQ